MQVKVERRNTRWGGECSGVVYRGEGGSERRRRRSIAPAGRCRRTCPRACAGPPPGASRRTPSPASPRPRPPPPPFPRSGRTALGSSGGGMRRGGCAAGRALGALAVGALAAGHAAAQEAGPAGNATEAGLAGNATEGGGVGEGALDAILAQVDFPTLATDPSQLI